jgi:hypothetical protein
MAQAGGFLFRKDEVSLVEKSVIGNLMGLRAFEKFFSPFGLCAFSLSVYGTQSSS